MSRFTPTRLAAFGAATAVVTGTFAAAPVASASVSSISIATAGTKPINQTTYAWGTVTGGAGIQACTQVLIGSTWSTSQCVKTTSTGSYTIPLTYAAGTPGTYSWRVTAGGKVSATATLTRTDGSTTPSKPVPGKVDYVKGRTTNGITLRPGSSTYAGDNGVKVYLVQTALGMNPGPMDSSLGPVRGSANGDYWLTTIATIKSFQKSKGLPQTGGIDAQTFYAAKDAARAGALIKSYNFDADSWKQGSTVAAGASHQAKVNAMIAWAKSKAKTYTPYVWGGTGQVGYDCSGFLLQALRAGGYDPKGVSNLTDVQPPSRLSQALYDHAGMRTVNVNSLVPGDFVYYGGTTSSIGHVSMYIGNGQVINAVGSKVQISWLSDTFGWKAKVSANRMP